MALQLANIQKIPATGLESVPSGNVLKFIWFFWKQGGWPVVMLLAIEAVSVALNSLGPLFIKMFLDKLSTDNPDWHAIAILLFTYVAILYILQPSVARAVNILHGVTFYPYYREMIRNQLTLYTRMNSFAYFQNDFAGRIANKISDTARAISELLSGIMFAVWGLVMTSLTAVGLLLSAHWSLALMFTAWLTIYALYILYMAPKMQPKAKAASDANSVVQGLLVDSITNIPMVKLFARGDSENRHTYEKSAIVTQKRRESSWQWNKMFIGMAILAFFLGAPIAALSLWGVKEGFLTVGDAVLAFAILPMVIATSWWAAEESMFIFEHMGTIEDGMDTLAKPHTVTDEAGAKELVVTPATADIAYSGVHFHYGQEDGVRVMEDFTLHIPAGQKVGIVGRSGAGKSTLTTLLVRAFDVEAGDICIAGQNIAEITQDSLRRAITTVTQESYMFHRSVFDNIAYGKPDATEAEVEAAAKAASAHDFIQLLSDAKGRTGYAAHVGERGVKLSGGQKQRIAIARAILKDAPILVLDEATSALDSESEVAIQHALEEVMTDKTVIAIAHRLSTLQQMDRIIVMDQGRIVEDGTHSTLIAQNGTYADLWAHQTGGYLQE